MAAAGCAEVHEPYADQAAPADDPPAMDVGGLRELQRLPVVDGDGRLWRIVADGTRAAVAARTAQGTSAVVLLAVDERGDVEITDRLDLPWSVVDLGWIGDELLIAGDDLVVVDGGGDSGRRALADVGVLTEPIAALEVLDGGRVAVLVRDRGLLWLERDPGARWSVLAESSVGAVLTPVGLCGAGTAVAVSWGNLGRMRLFETPGERWTVERLLVGQAAFNDGGPMVPSGAAFDGRRTWFAIPRIGVEGVDMRGEGRVLWVAPGALDVAPFGTLLALALGDGGVALVDAEDVDAPVVAGLDTPGRVRAVAVLGDRLLAGDDGTLVVLETSDVFSP